MLLAARGFALALIGLAWPSCLRSSPRGIATVACVVFIAFLHCVVARCCSGKDAEPKYCQILSGMASRRKRAKRGSSSRSPVSHPKPVDLAEMSEKALDLHVASAHLALDGSGGRKIARLAAHFTSLSCGQNQVALSQASPSASHSQSVSDVLYGGGGAFVKASHPTQTDHC